MFVVLHGQKLLLPRVVKSHLVFRSKIFQFKVGPTYACKQTKKTGKLLSLITAACKYLQVGQALLQLVERGINKAASLHKTGILLGAVCLAEKYDFEANGISNEALERCRDENQVDGIKALIAETITCPVCHKRQILHNKVPGVDYCECKSGSRVQWDRSYEGWLPFIEQENIIVWRKPHETWPHLYAYKVYGKYDDVSLCAFSEAQLSTSFRSKWDQSALDLHVLDSDRVLHSKQRRMHPHDAAQSFSAQDVVYWLVKFPGFFANRDYVYKRRYEIRSDRREVVIVNRAVEPDCDVTPVPGVHRVHYYWSVMVVKAYQRDFTKPGMEYVLSYFDNPGTSLPSSITNFIACTAFPNFLLRLHHASLELQHRHEAGENIYRSLPVYVQGIEIGDQRVSGLEENEFLPGPSAEVMETERPKFGCLTAIGKTEEFGNVQELMEAIGEITPSPEEKLLLANKIDYLIDQTLQKMGDNKPLINKLKQLKNRLDYLRVQHKMKDKEYVEENVGERFNRYENTKAHPALVRQMFEAMNDILKDNDIKTEKGLKSAEKSDGIKKNVSGGNLDTKASSLSEIEEPSRSSWFSSFFTSPNKPPTKTTLSNRDVKVIRNTNTSSVCHEVNEVSFRSNYVKDSEDSIHTTSEELPDRGCRCDCSSPDQYEGSSVRYYLYGWLLWSKPQKLKADLGPALPANDYCGEDNLSYNNNVMEDCAYQSDSSCDEATADDSSAKYVRQQGGEKMGERDCQTQTGSPEESNAHAWIWSPVTATKKGGLWLYSYFTNSRL